MKTASAKAMGGLVAAFLHGAWRPTPSLVSFSPADFETIAPLLLSTGAGGLGWWRVSETELQNSPAAAELHQAYRLYTLESRLNQPKIARVFTVLRSAGIEPVLIKGWAAARHYPEQGLRPYGDLDICVRSQDYRSAERALASPDLLKLKIDLHSGFAKFGIRSEEQLFARSELVKIGQTDVRVLCPEDHLRVVCFHLMREGAWRPLWLVDVAAALEARKKNFDWDYCLSDKVQARSVLSAISLAHLLLGASIEGIPGAHQFDKTPQWLIPTVLNEWGSAMPSMLSRAAVPMFFHLRGQGDFLQGLRHRWPNPIEATTTMHGPFNEIPRLPYQIGNSLVRIGSFLKQLLFTLKA